MVKVALETQNHNLLLLRCIGPVLMVQIEVELLMGEDRNILRILTEYVDVIIIASLFSS